MPSPRPIYLDHQATTPVDQRVLDQMWAYFSKHAGNPASQHLYGWQADAAVEQSRAIIAAAIAAQPQDIIFTSGATEANNLAIKGVAEAYLAKGRHLITVQTEHNAVLAPCRYLESLGFEVTYLPVNGAGLITLADLAAALRPDTVLVSVMAANNEIGVLQPLTEIGHLCRQHQVLFHTDAAQALTKIPLSVEDSNIDLLSMTAHKIYGPKGVGALYIRQQTRPDYPRPRLAPQVHGGSQEQGLRAGTLATPLIVGFGAAVQIGLAAQAQDSQHLTTLREHLWQRLQVELGGVVLNGDSQQCLPGCLSVSFTDVDGASLLLALQPAVALSSGSACSSKQLTPSHVLLALGRDPALARATLRFGIGRWNTLAEIDQVAAAVIREVKRLRGEFFKSEEGNQ
jgi:cysteine desulfurase